MKAGLPFQIGMGFNEVMRGYELTVQIGGFQTREEAEEAAEELAHYIGDAERVQSN
jgi:hypothetical protein